MYYNVRFQDIVAVSQINILTQNSIAMMLFLICKENSNPTVVIWKKINIAICLEFLERHSAVLSKKLLPRAFNCHERISEKNITPPPPPFLKCSLFTWSHHPHPIPILLDPYNQTQKTVQALTSGPNVKNNSLRSLHTLCFFSCKSSSFLNLQIWENNEIF